MLHVGPIAILRGGCELHPHALAGPLWFPSLWMFRFRTSAINSRRAALFVQDLTFSVFIFEMAQRTQYLAIWSMHRVAQVTRNWKIKPAVFVWVDFVYCRRAWSNPRLFWVKQKCKQNNYRRNIISNKFLVVAEKSFINIQEIISLLLF